MSGNANTARFPSAVLNDSRVAMLAFDHHTGTGDPSYENPDNPRQLQCARRDVTVNLTGGSGEFRIKVVN